MRRNGALQRSSDFSTTATTTFPPFHHYFLLSSTSRFALHFPDNTITMLAASHAEEYDKYFRGTSEKLHTVAQAVDAYWDKRTPSPSYLEGLKASLVSTAAGIYDGMSYKLRAGDATPEANTQLGAQAGGTRFEDKVVGGVDPENEGHPDDLVLESWAHCISKAKYAASKDDYVERAQGVVQVSRRHRWRRRTNWIGLDCGEDSFFVSNNRTVVGIADGVGGWRSTNIDPSEISNALMEEGKKLSERERDNTDPLDLMQRSFDEVVQSGNVRGGSTTSLFASIESNDNSRTRPGNAKGSLRVANLGDSGLLVFRASNIVYRAKELQHRFNAPYQLAIIPQKQKQQGCISDPPSKSFIDTVPVMEDDIVMLGTDGLFDNVPNSELKDHCDLVLNSTGDYGNYYTKFGEWQRNTNKARIYAKDAVVNVVNNAVLNARSRTFMTPFSYGLMEAGVATQNEARGMRSQQPEHVFERGSLFCNSVM